MFCSTIIPTVGRPTLSRAVKSVLDQDFPADQSEVIVVNDSGQPLVSALWQRSGRVQIVDTNRRERSVARNTGAAVAKGRYLHFLDDDDWLAPGALRRFGDLAQYRDAAWLYGSSQLVDRQGAPIIELHHGLEGNCFVQVMAGEWVPLQASLIASGPFFALGGFNPRIAGPEDIDLLRRVALRHDLVGMSAIVAYVVMGRNGSTTDYDRSPRYSRWARESILDAPGAFPRMRHSATSAGWHGRIVRAYMTSVLWNLRRGRWLSAASRAAFGIAGLASARERLFAASFWGAITKSYASETFRRGFRAAQRPLKAKDD